MDPQRARDKSIRLHAEESFGTARMAHRFVLQNIAERQPFAENLLARFRAEQAEIAEWLKVWIQTPILFADWLELRRRSPAPRSTP